MMPNLHSKENQVEKSSVPAEWRPVGQGREWHQREFHKISHDLRTDDGVQDSVHIEVLGPLESLQKMYFMKNMFMV